MYTQSGTRNIIIVPTRKGVFHMNEFKLKEDLLLGVATASTQIEGGDSNSNWNDWYEKGMIKDGSNPSRANDHYNRYIDDIDLMKSLNIQIYRMSLEWSRLQPSIDTFSDNEFKRYVHELEYLERNGIKVLLTLHHFNNPMWFEKIGGFLNPNSPKIFSKFVEKVISVFGRYVSDYVTVNEPNVYASSAYFFGEFPPGHSNNIKEYRIAMTNLAKCHIAAYNTIHDIRSKMGYSDTNVGYASHVRVFEPLRKHNLADIIAAKFMEKAFQIGIDDACMTGKVSFPIKRDKAFKKGKYYDFIGINYYSRSMVSGLAEQPKKDALHNDMGWEIYPEGLKRVCESYYAKYKAPIYITENGTADGSDAFRTKFIYDHLQVIANSNLPIQRYYHWTFIDNFEWMDGEKERFGLVELDYNTQIRKVRKSGWFYSDIIKNHGVTRQMIDKYLSKSNS